jgi:dihydroxyacid dehydratase/phosphogluconate dehydratase
MKGYDNAQFYSIHDCFGTTCEKVSRLKHILASVYTDLYSNEQYLKKFDNDVLDLIKNMTQYPIENREVTLEDGSKFIIHDID